MLNALTIRQYKKGNLGYARRVVLLLCLFAPIYLPVRARAVGFDIALFWFGLILSLLGLLMIVTIRKKLPKPPLYIVAFACFGLYIITHAQVSQYPNVAIQKSIMWLLPFLFAIVVKVMFYGRVGGCGVATDTMRALRIYGVIAAICGWIIVLTAILIGQEEVFHFIFSQIMPYFRSTEEMSALIELEERFNPGLNWVVADGKTLRNVSFFFSPIVTAAFLGMLLPFCWVKAERNERMVGLVIFLLLLSGLMLTMSRAGMLSAAISLVFISYFGGINRHKIIVIWLTLVVSGLFLLLSGDLQSRISGGSGAAESSIVYRMEFLKAGWQIAVERIWSTIGFGAYQQAVLSPIREYPHNQYVQLWAEVGVLGMLLYIVALLATIVTFVKRYRDTNSSMSVRVANLAFAGVATFIACYSMFEDLMATPQIVFTFFLLLGIAEVIVDQERKGSGCSI